MTMTAREAMKELSEFSVRKGKVETALETAGIPHDYADVIAGDIKEAGAFCAGLMEKVAGQSVHDQFVNVPCGIIQRHENKPGGALRRALPGACGAYVQWDINDALELAADILDDVNAHEEARKVRAMIL